jgi:hypothetical protein
MRGGAGSVVDVGGPVGCSDDGVPRGLISREKRPIRVPMWKLRYGAGEDNELGP